MPDKRALLTRLLGRLRIEEQREQFSRLEEFLSAHCFPKTCSKSRRAGSPSRQRGWWRRKTSRLRSGRLWIGSRITEAEAGYRVAVREVPLRSTQLHGSNPAWASGAALEASFGPFLSLDGRRFWFDFFRIEKLVALYVQGIAEPALLFKLRTRFRFIGIDLPLAADAASGYHLNAGSIWINSRLLATNAPWDFSPV